MSCCFDPGSGCTKAQTLEAECAALLARCKELAGQAYAPGQVESYVADNKTLRAALLAAAEGLVMAHDALSRGFGSRDPDALAAEKALAAARAAAVPLPAAQEGPRPKIAHAFVRAADAYGIDGCARIEGGTGAVRLCMMPEEAHEPAPPARDGFAEWHARECVGARPGHCDGTERHSPGASRRWAGKTCLEVHAAEAGARGPAREGGQDGSSQAEADQSAASTPRKGCTSARENGGESSQPAAPEGPQGPGQVLNLSPCGFRATHPWGGHKMPPCPNAKPCEVPGHEPAHSPEQASGERCRCGHVSGQHTPECQHHRGARDECPCLAFCPPPAGEGTREGEGCSSDGGVPRSTDGIASPSGRGADGSAASAETGAADPDTALVLMALDSCAAFYRPDVSPYDPLASRLRSGEVRLWPWPLSTKEKAIVVDAAERQEPATTEPAPKKPAPSIREILRSRCDR